MRKLLSTIALVGATTTTVWADADTTLESTEAFFGALEQGDFEALAALMSNDIVNTLPYAASGSTAPDAFRVFTGKQQVLAYFESAGQFIPSVSFVETDITLSNDGDTAFVETRGEMVLADGRPYRNLYVWRLDFEDGQISEITEYFNPVTAAIAFGRPLGPEAANN